MNYTARTLRLRIPRICVSVTGSDTAELLDKAEAILRENPLIELRLDYLKTPLQALPRVRRLMEMRPDAILIATCRRKENGGNFHGTVAEQLEVLHKAAEAGCPAVDLEIESAEAMQGAEWEDLRARAAIVLSSHDFEKTANLDETFERMRAFNADFYKVVGTANSLHDNVIMTHFLERHSSEYPMVGMCMGEQGMLSRVLGIRAGAAFTFGSAEQGKETAPGQPTYRELRDFYRVEQIEPVTKVYGIAGNPVSHSMSPWVMNSAFRRENVNAVYLPLHVKTLEDLLATATDLPLDGMSVTMPFKQGVVEHLDNSDVLTQRTGACNTIVRGKDGRLFGFNTDIYGIVAAIESRVALKEARVLVLGAGGAGRAAVFGFRAKGADVSILNRTQTTAAELAKQAGAKTVKRSDVAKMTFDVIFNATPVGMGADTGTPLEENELNTVWVFDSVYNPIETPLLKMAQAKGCGTISGTEMFVHQAARQFEIWTGKPAPIDSIRQVLLRQLGAVGSDNSPVLSTVVAPKKSVMANSSTAAAEAEAESEASAQKAGEPEPVAEAETKPKTAEVPSKHAAKKATASTHKPAAKAAAAAPKHGAVAAKTVATVAPAKNGGAKKTVVPAKVVKTAAPAKKAVPAKAVAAKSKTAPAKTVKPAVKPAAKKASAKKR